MDNFDNVRAAAAPVLENGIEFVKLGKEPSNEAVHSP